MAEFHLMHVIPDPTLHGLHGYRELIDTVAWGLTQLGHQVTYAVNQPSSRSRNVIFGAHMLSLEAITQLPANTICYQLEPVRNGDVSGLKRAMLTCVERFEIWDYSAANLPTWQKLNPLNIKLVPIGYAPILTRIPKAAVQDIDVLMYGMAGAKRMTALHRLSSAGIAVVFVSGLYGSARDRLISQSKIVLNINLFDFAQIFEIVRVSYLLANRKAVVATMDAQTFIEEDMASAVKVTTIDRLIEDCRHVLDDEKVRAEMESRGLEIMSRRDIRSILKAALQDA